MVTTTTVWPQYDGMRSNPNNVEVFQLAQMSSTLYPENLDNQVSNRSEDGTLIFGRRTWPNKEIAQKWCEYVLANYDVISCTIDPE